MRARLIAVQPADVPWTLGQVLLDLLSSHTNDPGNPEDSDFVVRFLDVLGGADLSFVSERWGNEAAMATATDEDRLRVAKRKAFKAFTTEQSEAVRQWLEEARHWKDLSLNVGDVDSALRFWRFLASRS